MKTYLSILAFAGFALSGFAQGTISFRNDSTHPVRQWISPTDPTVIDVPKGGGFVQYFWAPHGTPYTPYLWMEGWDKAQEYFLAENPGWYAAPTPTFIGPVPGVFLSGTQTLSPLAPAGSDVDMVVVGWLGNFPSLDAAFAGGSVVGATARFTTATADPTTTPMGTPVSIALVFPGLDLVIPEPSTFALAGLGVVALMTLRRRR